MTIKAPTSTVSLCVRSRQAASAETMCEHIGSEPRKDHAVFAGLAGKPDTEGLARLSF